MTLWCQETTYFFQLGIEVHFFVCIVKEGHWSRVNLMKREELLKDLHATRVLSFPNENEKKVYFNPYISAKAIKNPSNVEKLAIFPSRDQCLSLENICYSFLMLIAGECQWSVNIDL